MTYIKGIEMSIKDYLLMIVFAKITFSFKKMAWEIMGTFPCFR